MQTGGEATLSGMGPSLSRGTGCNRGRTHRIPLIRKGILIWFETLNGYFSGLVAAARNGTLYRYRLDGRAEVYADPASRFQPKGPHGPSEIVDPGLFTWTDQEWPGVSIDGQILYEMHVGTFTQEGTWESGARELPELASLGITVAGVDARGRIFGKFWLGIRRRESFCSDASLRTT